MIRKHSMGIYFVIVLSILFLMTSCALKAIPSSYNFVNDSEKVEINKLGNGKILIYNGATILHTIDNTARLNIWIDDKGLGQIRPGEYVVIDLTKGAYQFKILHLDMVNIRSNHNMEIDNTTTIIEVKPTITSNKVTIKNILPSNFEKFRYAVKR